MSSIKSNKHTDKSLKQLTDNENRLSYFKFRWPSWYLVDTFNSILIVYFIYYYYIIVAIKSEYGFINFTFIILFCVLSFILCSLLFLSYGTIKCMPYNITKISGNKITLQSASILLFFILKKKNIKFSEINKIFFLCVYSNKMIEIENKTLDMKNFNINEINFSNHSLVGISVETKHDEQILIYKNSYISQKVKEFIQSLMNQLIINNRLTNRKIMYGFLDSTEIRV